jgi:hypothetical protein
MRKMPELDVRWRRLSVNAKGQEAIIVVRRPLQILLLVSAAAMAMIVVVVAFRLEWPVLKDLCGVWDARLAL